MRGRSIHEVNRDFLDAVALADALEPGPELRKKLAGYKQFIERNAHRLGMHPGALREVALAEAEDSPVRQDVLAELPAWKLRRPWFRRLHCPTRHRNPALIRTIFVGTSVNAVALLKRKGRWHALAGCSDGCLRLYDLGMGQFVGPILEGHRAGVTGVALSSDGWHALSGSRDDTLRWWDLEGGVCLHTLKGHSNSVSAVALSSDGRHALSGSRDRTLRWWDMGSGVCLRTLQGHTAQVGAVALSPDGRHALSGSRDRTLRWWDLERGVCQHTLEGHTAHVNAVALSSDGRHALSGSDDHTLRWWDLHRGICLANFPCEEPVTSAALQWNPSEQSHVVVAGLGDGQVQFFRLEGR